MEHTRRPMLMGHLHVSVVLPGNKRICPFCLKDFKRAKDDSFAQQTEGWRESNHTWQELFSTLEFGQSFALDSELVECIFHPNYIPNSSQLLLFCYNSFHHPSPPPPAPHPPPVTHPLPLLSSLRHSPFPCPAL